MSEPRSPVRTSGLDHPAFQPRHKPDRSKRYRWLISYADMITLLLAMFILMLSLSNVDMKKFRDQAGEMRRVFNQVTAASTAPGPGVREDVIDEDVIAAARQRAWRTAAMAEIGAALAAEIAARSTFVFETDHDIVIRFPDHTAFASGSAELQEAILPALDRLAAVLRAVEGQIVVSGHTDNVPIVTDRFRSNWDLSVARAVSVVHYLLKDDRLSSARITAQGFADSRPLADNALADGRAQNRRVEISIAMPDEIAATPVPRRR